MENNENVNNKNDQKDQNKVTDIKDKQDQSVQEIEQRPNFNPTDIEGQNKLTDWIEGLAKKSAIKNQMLCQKVVLIDENTPNMWAMLLHFPGVTEASDIQTDSMNDEGALSLGKLFAKAVKAGVVVSPKIDDVDTFINTHKSAGKAGNEIFNFLNAGINGDLK
ncbi:MULTISPECIES: hypothetical protein [Lactobacillus]|uniref:Uncharacterized protein n=1 Tax=Lactobacillus xujianguonis TaxID=2495899 RepID=A0A437SSV4_9LACO|nr:MULTISPECIES: hypothetical protein [Lactobacillus]RVU70011.1 hypothetical protein EJK17_09755 [Lactobacillus xujianguonis]RVU73458.1 hypothetical protein EJK20_08225 [Lactobacillus xujianguonis]